MVGPTVPENDSRKGDQDNGGQSAGSSSDATAPQNRTTSSRRRLLHLIGAGGVASVAGCAMVLPDDGDSQPDNSPTSPGTGDGTANDGGKGTGKLAESATIGVDYPVTSFLFYDTLARYTRTFESLVRTTPNLGVKPSLAKSWSRTGKLTWEFTLREDVKYHNGDRLNADRVLEMFEWLLEDYSKPVSTPLTANTTADGVRKLDEMTIEMETIVPTANQPANLAILVQPGVHPESSLHTEKVTTKGDFSYLIGTGPYKVEEVKRGQHMKLAAFDDYWGGEPITDELVVRQFSDRNTLALALKGQEVDVGLELPANQYEPIENADQSTTATRTGPKNATLWFNLTEKPGTDVKFRKGLNYAVSQQKIVKATQNGLATPARGPVPPMVWYAGHEKLPAYGPNKAKAKTLIEESEYSDETLTLLAHGQAPRESKLVAQILSQAFTEIGVDVDVQLVGLSSWTERRDDGEGDLFLGEATSNAPNEPLTHQIGRYVSHIRFGQEFRLDQQDRLDELFSIGRTSTGKRKEDALLEAQRIIVEEGVEVPLYHEDYLVGMMAGAEGVDWHPLSEYSRLERLKYVK